jgi:hypothetical protein
MQSAQHNNQEHPIYSLSNHTTTTTIIIIIIIIDAVQRWCGVKLCGT